MHAYGDVIREFSMHILTYLHNISKYKGDTFLLHFLTSQSDNDLINHRNIFRI